VKAVALFLLMCSPGPADIPSCGNAYSKADYATAIKECSPLAKEGNSKAQFYLGFMYANGKGVPQDYQEAVRWYRLAADQGQVDGQFRLGMMYESGEGVPQDYKEAARLYRLAADQGVANAQCLLGGMYEKGQGVPQDYVQAHMWYNLAGASGVAQCVQFRDYIAKMMTPTQIGEAQRLAREWKPTTAQ